MTDLLKFIKDRFVPGSRKIPSFTKEGPGRRAYTAKERQAIINRRKQQHA